MLSLNNLIGSVHVSAAVVLGPPQMLSFVDTHPKPVLINTHPSCDPWFVCMWIQSKWATDFQNINNNNKNCVNVR